MPYPISFTLNVKNADDEDAVLKMEVDETATFRMSIDDVEVANGAWSSLDFDNTATLKNELTTFIKKADGK